MQRPTRQGTGTLVLRSMLAVFAALLCLGAFGAVSPAWAGDFVFKGRGYGHGVGMSQWGAWAAARDGKDFRWIVGFYYPGTALESLSDPNTELLVKLSSEPWRSVSLLSQNFTQVDLRASTADAVLVKHSASVETTEKLPAGSLANLTLKNGKVQIFTLAAGKWQGGFDWIEARPASGGRVFVQFRMGDNTIAGREYWGKMKVEPSPTSGNLCAFNTVPVEKYLRSIAEVEYDWAMSSQPGAYAPEAVKAQAVAARTYALANRDPYLNDNQWDQVYRGYTFEAQHPGIGEAAEKTAGLVLKYQGKVISSFFSSSSGGYTYAWNPALYPYLPAQRDPYSLQAPPKTLDSHGPGYAWTCSISADELSSKVDGMTDTSGKDVDVGTVTKVEVASRQTADPESHASTIRLTGFKGQAVVSASSLRSLFGYALLRSTLILEITNPVSSSPPPPDQFTDVPRGHMYYKEIMRVAAAGLVCGFPDEEFRPEDSVSRWQFAKMAVGLHNQLFPSSPIALVNVTTQPFWDVAVRTDVLGDESDWVAAAKKAGLVEGVTTTSFRPYEPVRRDQMASMLVRALGWEDEAAALPAATKGFEDVPESSPHYDATRYLKSEGILNGYAAPEGGAGVALRAEEATKRMHVAVILCRVLDHGK